MEEATFPATYFTNGGMLDEGFANGRIPAPLVLHPKLFLGTMFQKGLFISGTLSDPASVAYDGLSHSTASTPSRDAPVVEIGSFAGGSPVSISPWAADENTSERPSRSGRTSKSSNDEGAGCRVDRFISFLPSLWHQGIGTDLLGFALEVAQIGRAYVGRLHGRGRLSTSEGDSCPRRENDIQAIFGSRASGAVDADGFSDDPRKRSRRRLPEGTFESAWKDPLRERQSPIRTEQPAASGLQTPPG
jgi:hypothetical protein